MWPRQLTFALGAVIAALTGLTAVVILGMLAWGRGARASGANIAAIGGALLGGVLRDFGDWAAPGASPNLHYGNLAINVTRCDGTLMDAQVMQAILDEVAAASDQHPYEAVDVLWVALVKASNTMPGANEHRRMLALVEAMPLEAVQQVLQLSAIDDLLDLDPPIETVLADSHERLAPEATQEAIKTVRSKRYDQPREALIALGEMLKRIRNKRAHGFKTRKGPRDQEIMSAAKPILQAFCRGAVTKT